MSVLYLLGSIIVSLFTFIMTIITTFADPESRIHNMFGNTETWICIGVCIALLALGALTERDME